MTGAANGLRIGFIGLGNVGGKLAGSLQRCGFPLTVHELDRSRARPFIDRGAGWANTPGHVADSADILITCLPSPAACAEVLEAKTGLLSGLGPGKTWLEMSTTDESEVRRLGALVEARGATAMDCPVSGGCHRAATGNISIFAGGTREAFESVLPVLSAMGRRILHTGSLGSASVLKVVTNYLATANLVALGEALMVAKQAGMDLTTAYEAIRISSGNSFVHETESQVILNGSYDIGFTMELVQKDLGLFQDVADRTGVSLELSPMLERIFADGAERYGESAWSSMIVRRLEDACGSLLRAPGFPARLIDDEPEEPGREVPTSR